MGGSGGDIGGRVFFHVLGFKIMKLCGDLSLLLIWLELVLNQLFDNIFSENRFFRFFSGVIYTIFSGFFSDDFTIKKIDF